MKLKIIITLLTKAYKNSLINGLVDKGFAIEPGIKGGEYVAGGESGSCVMVFRIDKQITLSKDSKSTEYEAVSKKLTSVIEGNGIKYHSLYYEDVASFQSTICGPNFNFSFDEETQNQFDKWQRLKSLK